VDHDGNRLVVRGPPVRSIGPVWTTTAIDWSYAGHEATSVARQICKSHNCTCSVDWSCAGHDVKPVGPRGPRGCLPGAPAQRLRRMLYLVSEWTTAAVDWSRVSRDCACYVDWSCVDHDVKPVGPRGPRGCLPGAPAQPVRRMLYFCCRRRRCRQRDVERVFSLSDVVSFRLPGWFGTPLVRLLRAACARNLNWDLKFIREKRTMYGSAA